MLEYKCKNNNRSEIYYKLLFRSEEESEHVAKKKTSPEAETELLEMDIEVAKKQDRKGENFKSTLILSKGIFVCDII